MSAAQNGRRDENDEWVPEKGLEPSRPKAQEPKSCVSANSTTPADNRGESTIRPPSGANDGPVSVVRPAAGRRGPPIGASLTRC